MSRHYKQNTTASKRKLSLRLLLLVAAPLVTLCAATAADSHALRGVLDDVRNADFIKDFYGSDIAPGVTEEDREKAAKMIEDNHNRARYTFFSSGNQLKEVPGRFCLAGNYTDPDSPPSYDMEDCHWPEYIESLFLISALAFIIAIIIFPILYVALGVGRCCCCGGWRPSTALCGGRDKDFDPAAAGYTALCALILLVIACVLAAIAVVGAALGLYGNAVMAQGVKDVATHVSGTLNKLIDVVQSVVTIVENQAQKLAGLVGQDDSKVFDAVRSLSNGTLSVARLVTDNLDKIDIPRQVFIYITLLVPLVLFALLILSCPLFSCLAYAMVAGGFIFSAMALCTFAVHYPVASGLADVCVYLDEATKPESPYYKQYMQWIFDCTEDSPIVKFTDTVTGFINKTVDSTCTSFDTLCDVTVPCDKNGDRTIAKGEECTMINCEHGDACSADTLLAWTSESLYDWKIGCFLKTDAGLVLEGQCPYSSTLTSLTSDECSKLNDEARNRTFVPAFCGGNDKPVSAEWCAANCTMDELRTNSSVILDYTSSFSALVDVLNKQIKPYLNCETVVNITNLVRDFLCVDVVIATTPIFAGEALVAIACFAGTFVAMLGAKRFNKRNMIPGGGGGSDSSDSGSELDSV